MERVVEHSNLRLAYQRVIENKGAPGVDQVTVAEFKDWLKTHCPSVKQALLEGRYLPQPVRRVDIPKPSGGMRTLGVPTVVDRLIQQALHQVLQPLFEPTFSDGSYGFRPGRWARGVRVFLEKVLHLQINAAKSAVARPWELRFLGFSFTAQRDSRVRIALENRA